MKFAILRASLLIAAPVALFPGCWLVVGDLPPPLPGDEAAGGANDTAGGGTGASQASGGTAGSAGTTSDPCDRDADGYDAEGACGGDDCDDQDPNVFPTQSKHFAAEGNVDYDYDCDGRPEQEQMKAIVCAELPAVSDCSTEEGFLDTLPACGAAGVWGRCEKQGTLNMCMNHELDEGRLMKCQ